MTDDHPTEAEAQYDRACRSFDHHIAGFVFATTRRNR